MVLTLRVAGTAFLLITAVGFVRELPTAVMAAAFFGLCLLGLGSLLERIGGGR